MNQNTSNPVLPPTLQKKQNGIERLKALTVAALQWADESLRESRWRLIIAGLLLREVKAGLGHGRFEDFLRETFPSRSVSQKRVWIRAGETILAEWEQEGHLIEVEAVCVEIVNSTGNALTAPAREFRDGIARLIEGRTMRDIIDRVGTGGEDYNSAKAAVNGEENGGNPLPEERGKSHIYIANLCQKFIGHVAARRKGGNYTGYKKFSPADENSVVNSLRELGKYLPPQILKPVVDAWSEESRKHETVRASSRK